MSAIEAIQGAFDDAEPDTSIQPGDRVRSYDFAGNLTCYAEGLVKHITEPMEGCPRYCIEVERRVFGGNEVTPEAPEVFPPVNGTPTMMGKLTNLVVKLSAH